MEMDSKKPLLSICIPTYNRAEYLEKSMMAIVHQNGFDMIEVLISDNCSSDTTEEIGRRYAQQYENVRYYRQEETGPATKNYLFLLNNANGVVRKLSNDTLVYKEDAISRLLWVIQRFSEERPLLCFTDDGDDSLYDEIIVEQSEQIGFLNTIDSYVRFLGYNLTWIGNIILWEEDCKDLSVMEKNLKTSLGQVPFILSVFEKHGRAIVLRSLNESIQQTGKKNISYGLFRVFHENFMSFLEDLLDEKKISENTYEFVKRNLLMHFFAEWVAETKENPELYVLSDENLPKLIKTAYGKESYFNEYKREVIRNRIRKKKGKVKRRIKAIVIRRE